MAEKRSKSQGAEHNSSTAVVEPQAEHAVDAIDATQSESIDENSTPGDEPAQENSDEVVEKENVGLATISNSQDEAAETKAEAPETVAGLDETQSIESAAIANERAEAEPVKPEASSTVEVIVNSGDEQSALQSDAPESKTPEDATENKIDAPETNQKANSSDQEETKIVDRPLTQHRVSRILDAVLEEEVPEADAGDNHARFRYPVYIDGLLAIGLLIAVAGFTIGLFKMYVTHQAQQRIMQSDYKSAIAILRTSPMPAMFNVDGSDPEETLSQALYLDSLKKFDDGDSNGALAELEQIHAGSKYFDQAQKLLSDNFVPSDTVLQCGVTEEAQLQQQQQQQ